MPPASAEPFCEIGEVLIRRAKQIAKMGFAFELLNSGGDEFAGAQVGRESDQAVAGSLARGREVVYVFISICRTSQPAPPPDGLRVGGSHFLPRRLVCRVGRPLFYVLALPLLDIMEEPSALTSDVVGPRKFAISYPAPQRLPVHGKPALYVCDFQPNWIGMHGASLATRDNERERKERKRGFPRIVLFIYFG